MYCIQRSAELMTAVDMQSCHRDADSTLAKRKKHTMMHISLGCTQCGTGSMSITERQLDDPFGAS